MALVDLFLRNADVAPTTRTGFSVMRAVSVWRSRQALARLDDAALADIGLTPAKAAQEAAKPVWDVPANWRD